MEKNEKKNLLLSIIIRNNFLSYDLISLLHGALETMRTQRSQRYLLHRNVNWICEMKFLFLASPLLSVITSLLSVPFNLHRFVLKEFSASCSPEISHISAPKLNSRETWNQSCIFKELRDIDPENGYLIEIEFMFFASEMLFSFKRFPLPRELCLFRRPLHSDFSSLVVE